MLLCVELWNKYELILIFKKKPLINCLRDNIACQASWKKTCSIQGRKWQNKQEKNAQHTGISDKSSSLVIAFCKTCMPLLLRMSTHLWSTSSVIKTLSICTTIPVIVGVSRLLLNTGDQREQAWPIFSQYVRCYWPISRINILTKSPTKQKNFYTHEISLKHTNIHTLRFVIIILLQL